MTLMISIFVAGLVFLSEPQGYQHMERVEGRVLHVYADSVGYKTIGVGHLLTPTEKTTGKIWINKVAVPWTKGLTYAQATALLRQDAGFAERAINDYVHLPLLQHQFDALVSFVFNIGVPRFKTSTLLRKLNRGDYADVPSEMQRWVSAGGKRNPGLVARRRRESALWRGEP